MIDTNEHLTTVKRGSFCYKIEVAGLNELILSQHLRSKPPPTRTPGSQKIDSIFGSSALDMINGGYAPFLGLHITDYHG